MAPKYKNDVARCFALLKVDHNWKTASENTVAFMNAVIDLSKILYKTAKVFGGSKMLAVNEDFDQFSKALVSYLASYGCPYDCVTNSSVGEPFKTSENRLLVLRYLGTEIMTHQRLNSLPNQNGSSHHMNKVNTAEMSLYVQRACSALNIPLPKEDFNITELFNSLCKASAEAMKRCPPMHYGQPMLPLQGLSDRQWSQISRLAALLQQEYECRQATLLKRLDVTVQSFKWSDKAKRNLEAISTVYGPIRSKMAKSKVPGLPDLVAVRDNMVLRIDKTSGKKARSYTSCDLNKILIGKVPDRGGRAWELEPPPPEMPSFKQRQPDRGRGGGGFRGDGGRGNRGGGGRGGFGQGPTQQPQSYHKPPAPTAQRGGGDYVVTPASALTAATLTQQMYGLSFDPAAAAYLPHSGGYVFQPTNGQGGNMHSAYGPRGGRGRGRY